MTARNVSQSDQTGQTQEFAWRAHPAREQTGKAIAAGLLILALAAAAGVAFGPWWTPFTLAVLMMALNRFFFPSRFAIDRESITAQYPLRRLRMRWCDLRRFVHDGHGGYLSTRARRSRMDAYTSMHILFGLDPQGVIGEIRARMPRGDQACQK